MQFSLSDEQRLIQDSALDWLRGQYGFQQRAAGVHRDGGAPQAWRAFADMGWLGLPLPESAGGSGGGLLESGLLMHAFGRHLVVEPYHGCVLQAARLLALAGTAEQQQRWLPAVAAGGLRLAFAHAEPGVDDPWEPRQTVARRESGGWRLRGDKQLVRGGPGAAAWVVSARDADEPACTRLFVLDPQRQGARLDAYDTTDGGRAADAWLDLHLGGDALVGGAADATALLHQVIAEGIALHCWEAAGAMQAVLEQTTGYMQQRRQFGQPLASFQAVQHGLAEMAVHCTEAQAASELAVLRIAQEPAAGAALAAAALNKVARGARYVAQQAVQFHGAMGVCEELSVASTFRMLLAWSQQHGAVAGHAARLGRSLLASRRHACSQVLGPPQANAGMS